MHKRFLPVFFAIIIFSCGKPPAENTSVDSTAINEVPLEDSVENGNMDGDYFAPGDSSDIDLEKESEEMISIHQPVIDVCGFSNDGKYFAFTQIVNGEAMDGRGWVFVIDVAKNEWASKPAIIEEAYEDLEPGVARKRDSMLVKYNIVHHKNIGNEYNLKDKHIVTIGSAKYDVNLQVTNMLIDLRVKGNGKDIILQKDKSLPKSRGSVKEYRLNKAYVLGDKIAVFVEYDGDLFEGFEGYRYFDRKNIAVTGVIK